MTGQDDYDLVLTPPARRALTDKLSEAVAAAVIDLLTTTLVAQSRRVGRPLRGELSGLWAARRGTYRVLYRLNEEDREAIIIRVDHRRDDLPSALIRRASTRPERGSRTLCFRARPAH